MPLTEKGNEIKAHMEKEYGVKKGEEVFYASKNAGTISGVDEPKVKTSREQYNKGHHALYDSPGAVPTTGLFTARPADSPLKDNAFKFLNRY